MFKFSLGQAVRRTDFAKTEGTVIGRAEFRNGTTEYQVKFKAGGPSRVAWWREGVMEASSKRPAGGSKT